MVLSILKIKKNKIQSANVQIFKSSNGKKLYKFTTESTNANKISRNSNKEIRNVQIDGTIKLFDSKFDGTLYELSNATNLGFFDGALQANDVRNETYRLNTVFNNLSSISSNADVSSVGIEIRESDLTPSNIQEQRPGIIEVNSFPNTSSPEAGSKDFFDQVAQGNNYISFEDNDPFPGRELIDMKNSGKLFTDVSNLVANGGDVFKIGLKAKNENSSGLLTNIDKAVLLVEIANSPTTIPAPSFPVLPDENDGIATINCDPYRLSWYINIDRNDERSYSSRLLFDDDSSFSTPEVDITIESDRINRELIELPSDETNKLYYWKVKAFNDEGGESPWSEIRTGKTGDTISNSCYDRDRGGRGR